MQSDTGQYRNGLPAVHYSAETGHVQCNAAQHGTEVFAVQYNAEVG